MIKVNAADCDTLMTLGIEDAEYFDVREGEVDFYGLYKPLEPGLFRRIPEECAKATSENVLHLSTNTAGGRIRFMTDSRYIAISVRSPERATMPHMTIVGSSGFDLYEITEGSYKFRAAFQPPADTKLVQNSVALVGEGGMREYMIEFPLYDNVQKLYLGVARGSEVKRGGSYRDLAPVVYYGSSITQGGCASRPGNCYQAIISRKYNLDYINLGFSGSARGENAIRDYMAGLDMSLFFLDYDHNAPNAAHLEQTHKPLYLAIREANPKLPIIMASRTDIPKTAAEKKDMEARRAVVRATYDYAVASGDRRVYFIDGQSVFAPYGDSCTVDGCHPNDLGFYAMANSFGDVIEKALELLR